MSSTLSSGGGGAEESCTRPVLGVLIESATRQARLAANHVLFYHLPMICRSIEGSFLNEALVKLSLNNR